MPTPTWSASDEACGPSAFRRRALKTLLASALVLLSGSLAEAQDPPIGGELVSQGPPGDQRDVAFGIDSAGRRWVAAAGGETSGIELYEILPDDRIRLRDRSSLTPGRTSRDVKAFHTGGRLYFVVGEESPNFTPIVTGPGARIFGVDAAGRLQHIAYVPFLQGVHNQAVCEIGGRVYYFAPDGVAHGGPGVFIFDLTVPAQPVLVGLINAGLPQLTGCGSSPLDAHVHSVTARINGTNGRAYLYLSVQPSLLQICSADYISMYDVTDPARARLVALQVTSLQGYYPPHSCWPSDDGTRLYVTSEYYANPLRIYDISNPVPNDPVSGFRLVHEIPTSGPRTVYHDAEVLQDQLLVVSGYEDGTWVFSLEDLDHPVRIARFDTSTGQPWNSGLVGNWGSAAEIRKDAFGLTREVRVYAGDMQRGLHLFRLTMPNLRMASSQVSYCPQQVFRLESYIDNAGPALPTGPLLWQLRLEFGPFGSISLDQGVLPTLASGGLVSSSYSVPVPDIYPLTELEFQAVGHVFEPFGCLGLERRIRVKIRTQRCP